MADNYTACWGSDVYVDITLVPIYGPWLISPQQQVVHLAYIPPWFIYYMCEEASKWFQNSEKIFKLLILYNYNNYYAISTNLCAESTQFFGQSSSDNIWFSI